MRRPLIVLTLIAGAFLRFVWLGDIEYKFDEHWMFTHAMEAARGGPWPWVGMPSSVGTPNPGMSVWVFVLLKWLTGAQTPIGLSGAVAALGFVAEILLLVWVVRRSPPAERDTWLWGWALSSVAFNSIQWQRKIWTLSVMPIFMVGALWGWSERRRTWGSFLWAVMLTCLGQIHMPGFFWALAWGLWALRARGLRWGAVVLGIGVSAWPMIPWLQELARLRASQGGGAGGWSWSLEEILQFKFWLYWFTDAVGIQQSFVLGRKAFWEWVLQPWVAPLWLVCASAALGAIGLQVRAFIMRKPWSARSRQLTPSEARNLTRMGLWIFGGLLTASAIPIHRHYLGTAFPLTSVWVAGAWLQGWPKRAHTILALLWAAMLLSSVSFLVYIHVNGGAPGADYGVTYSRAYLPQAPAP